MKKYALPLALVGMVALQACNEQSTGDSAAAPGAAAAVTLETTEQRLSYGIAFGLGQRMAADSVPVDPDAFAAGFRDAVTGAEPRMTEEEITAEMQAFQERAMAAQAAQQGSSSSVQVGVPPSIARWISASSVSGVPRLILRNSTPTVDSPLSGSIDCRWT